MSTDRGWLESYQTRVNEQLNQYLNDTSVPEQLRAAMFYGVFNGGKRIRPMLAYMAAEAVSHHAVSQGLSQPLDLSSVDRAACAIEMIHSYSLIHDDLPAMDDDDLRRGKPTLHIQFDEATAILAGDALQTLAFELLASDERLKPEIRLSLIQVIARGAGPTGMVAGQMIDLEAETKNIDEAALINMHRRKTGDLISASVMAGAIVAEADPVIEEQLSQFAYHLGLAFQVKDDILDQIGDTEVMGKPQGSDQASSKTTFITSLGLDGATSYLNELHSQTLGCLKPLGESAATLIKLTDFVISRDH